MYIFQPDRHLLKEQIRKYSRYVSGDVLDAGAGDFSRYEGLFTCDSYTKMDLQQNDNIDVIGNVENIPFGDAHFDSIVCTQVIGEVQDLNRAVQEFYRVLRPGGVVLLTTGFLSPTLNTSFDYWRFTKFGLRLIFEKAGFKIIALDQRGGFFSVKAQNTIRYLIDRFNLYQHNWARILNPLFRIYSELMFFLDGIDKSRANRKFAIGWCLVAQKK